MRTSKTIWVGALIACVACSAESDSIPSELVPVGDVQELMAHMVEPAADVYWDAVGVVVDYEGEHPMRPETDEEWVAVSNAAFTLAESANLMMLDGRALDHGTWMTLSQQFREVSIRALEAAEARNLDAIFDMGAEVYYSCTNCHAQYALETLRPTDARAN